MEQIELEVFGLSKFRNNDTGLFLRRKKTNDKHCV